MEKTNLFARYNVISKTYQVIHFESNRCPQPKNPFWFLLGKCNLKDIAQLSGDDLYKKFNSIYHLRENLKIKGIKFTNNEVC